MLTVLLCPAWPSQAELVVIVNAGRTIEHVSQEDVVNIFMGRSRKLSDGMAVQPLDVKGDALERKEFYKKLLDKSLADINAYWARLIFSGRTSPPFAVDTPQGVLDRIARDSTTIGYIGRNLVNNQVKVVYAFPE